MSDIQIKALTLSDEAASQLADILIEVVANGGSVSFMHPLASQAARAFWEKSLASADRGERVVLGAFDGEALVGTVTLILDCPENQPHRAEIAKLMMRMSHRGRGIAAALVRRAESIAAERGRTLLNLDTAVVDGAAGLYEGLGYTLTGEIPYYALTPHGAMSGTLIYWKRIGGTAG